MIDFFERRFIKLKTFFSNFNIGTDKTTTMNKTRTATRTRTRTANNDAPVMQFEEQQ